MDVGLKVFAYGPREYAKKGWNKFDLVCTVMACIDLVLSLSIYLATTSFAREWSMYVSGDLINIVRVARIFRLSRIFPELEILLTSFTESLVAMAWVVVLGFTCLYFVACGATIFIGRRDQLPSEDSAQIRELRTHFETIGISMFTLTEFGVGGWSAYVRPVLLTRPFLAFCGVAFVIASSLFMLNLLTSVVVDSMMKAQQKRLDETNAAAQKRKQELQDRLFAALLQLNRQRDLITREDLQNWMSHVAVNTIMKDLNWTTTYIMALFTLVDHESCGEVSLRNLKGTVADAKSALTAHSYVQFSMNFVRRVDFTDRLFGRMVCSALKISGEGLDSIDPEVLPFIKTVSASEVFPTPRPVFTPRPPVVI